jgi:integrase
MGTEWAQIHVVPTEGTMSDGVRKLANGSWNARYVGPDGKRYGRTFGVKRDAVTWRGQELRLIDLDEWTPPAARKPKYEPVDDGPTVAEWVGKCIDARATRSRRPLKPTTVDNYRKLLRLSIEPTSLGSMPLTEVRREHVVAWREQLPKATRTQNGKAYELLVSMFSDAVTEGLIASSPATLRGAGTPERAREPQTMTPAEVNAYLDAAPPKWRVALLLSVTCGLRIGEVLALRDRDLDLELGQLHVRRTVAKIDDGDGHRRIVLQEPKTKEAVRTVHLLPHTLGELRAWRAMRPKLRVDDLLFPNQFGKPLNDDVLRRAHKKAAEAIGRSDLRNHDLRATAATMSAQSGATVREIQAQLGHTTPAMALRYQTASAERDAERARRVSDAWGTGQT